MDEKGGRRGEIKWESTWRERAGESLHGTSKVPVIQGPGDVRSGLHVLVLWTRQCQNLKDSSSLIVLNMFSRERERERDGGIVR